MREYLFPSPVMATCLTPIICMTYAQCNPGASFTKNGLTLTPVWISNYIRYKVWDEITYPFTNFIGTIIEV